MEAEGGAATGDDQTGEVVGGVPGGGDDQDLLSGVMTLDKVGGRVEAVGGGGGFNEADGRGHSSRLRDDYRVT